MLPGVIDRWLPRRMHSLGTDGFGRSDSRAALRNFFEIDARFITLTTLHALQQENAIDSDVVAQAIRQFDIDVEKPDPAR
jgi:pyruvate dehydrogenase E1 component